MALGRAVVLPTGMGPVVPGEVVVPVDAPGVPDELARAVAAAWARPPAELPQGPVHSEDHGAGPRGWACVPVMFAAPTTAQARANGEPDTLYCSAHGTVYNTFCMRDSGFPAGAVLYAALSRHKDGAVTAVALHAEWAKDTRAARVPVWAHRTVQFWRLFKRYTAAPLPTYARWEPDTNVLVCDPGVYSGFAETTAASAGGAASAPGFAETTAASAGGAMATSGPGFWAAPLTPQHVLYNAVVVLGVAAAAVASTGAAAMVLGAVGSSAAGGGGGGGGDDDDDDDDAHPRFSQVFPSQFLAPEVDVFVQRTWLSKDACCSDDCVGAVAVALNAHPLRRAHMYMLDVLVGRHSRTAAAVAKPLWAQACVASGVRQAPTTAWWPPAEAAAEAADTVHFVQLASNLPDKVGTAATTLRHFLLLQYTVRAADRTVTHIHYADPFWVEDYATPTFWQRVRDEINCRGLVLTPDTVYINQHMLLHRQSQEVFVTKNACGWLCLQGAARLMLGVVPDTVNWRRIRTGLLASAAAVLHG
jgi:hypothetical protein